MAHDGRAVHFHNRLYDVTYQGVLSAVVHVRGVDDDGRPTIISGPMDSFQWRATYLGFQPAEPQRDSRHLPA
ncbi:hypothetical protein [Deinococcus aquaticus]|uniref:hypothetical protein n=1 Tax=Deinococcus aquaticus TaxID=328692 RepID=UPI00360C0B39